MIGAAETSLKLDLAGYVPLTQHGFALPCFARGRQPNTWYTAVCSVSGDHVGKIVGFETFASEEIKPIVETDVRTLQVGDPWCDIFLWRGQYYVGVPDEIWAAIASFRDDIRARAPISLLDLGTYSSSADVAGLARASFDYVHAHFGRTRARAWQRDIFIRQRAILILQRLRDNGLLRGDRRLLQSIELTEQDGVIGLNAPELLKNELRLTGCDELLLNDLRTITSALPIEISFRSGRLETLSSNSFTDESISDPINDPYLNPDKRLNVLIVAIGKRAEQIAKHISSPEWVPLWGRDQSELKDVHVSHLSDLRERVYYKTGINIHVTSERDMPPNVDGRYHTLIAIVDDDLLCDGTLTKRQTAVLQHISQIDAVRMLAPALPRHHPTKFMTVGNLPNEETGFKLLLDTATARSPFWSGNPRRSLDRRIADTILGAALLSVDESPLAEFLMGQHFGNAILSLALESPHRTAKRPSSASFGMASEIMGVVEDDKDTLFQRGFNTKWIARGTGWAPIWGAARVRTLKGGFETFALAIIQTVAGSSRLTPIPKDIMRLLKFPDQACGLVLRKNQKLALLAETPNIKMIRGAVSEGWTLARYTDSETIELIAEGKHEPGHLILPREIQLINVRRAPQNRNFAVRGIDPRDVLKFSRDQLYPDQRGWGGLLNNSRRYRTAISDRYENKSEEWIVPLNDIIDGLKRHDPSVLSFIKRLHVRRSDLTRLPRRRSDLRVAWARPPRGMKRFIVADGVVPIVLRMLKENEVPAQKFFLLAGDEAVPALLQSRIFEVWARATLSRSTSWMSRFSIGGTFETFPIRKPFEFHSYLTFESAAGRLKRRAKEWLNYVSSLDSDADWFEGDEAPNNSLRRQLDEEVFRVYGLGPDPTELEILERLLSINGEY